MTSAEVLRIAPISGSYTELQFDARGNSTWIKFTDDDCEEWCGVFGGGMTSESIVANSEASPLAFVVSAGQGYLVDVNARRVLLKTSTSQLTSALFVPQSARVVACDWTNIFIFEPDGSVWDSGRVSFDGINVTEVTPERAKGNVNDLSDNWPEFVLWLSPPSFSCSWRYRE